MHEVASSLKKPMCAIFLIVEAVLFGKDMAVMAPGAPVLNVIVSI
jgi:hypothetical protein